MPKSFFILFWFYFLDDDVIFLAVVTVYPLARYGPLSLFSLCWLFNYFWLLPSFSAFFHLVGRVFLLLLLLLFVMKDTTRAQPLSLRMDSSAR